MDHRTDGGTADCTERYNVAASHSPPHLVERKKGSGTNIAPRWGDIASSDCSMIQRFAPPWRAISTAFCFAEEQNTEPARKVESFRGSHHRGANPEAGAIWRHPHAGTRRLELAPLPASAGQQKPAPSSWRPGLHELEHRHSRLGEFLRRDAGYLGPFACVGTAWAGGWRDTPAREKGPVC